MKDNDSIDLLSLERTLLAAERTFGSWIRTALSAMAGGLAMLRLIHFKTPTHVVIAHLIGQILIIWGFCVIVLSAIDYKRKLQQTVEMTQSYKLSSIKFIIMVIPLIIVCFLLLWVTLPY